MTTEAQRKAIEKYNREKLDHLHIRLPKGKKDIISKHAATRGESVNAFVNRAIDQAIESDNRAE